MAAPALRPLGVLTFTMKETQVLRNTPAGTRVIVEFEDVKLKGERLEAVQHGGHAADWLVVSAEGIATLDIRFLLVTPGGARLYVHGLGRTDANEFPRGGPMYFFPQFETDDPALAWVNRLAVVGRGTAAGKQATFELFELA